MNTEESSEAVLATLRQIIRAIDIQSKQLIKKFGLSGPQLIILKEIYHSPDRQISEIARRVSLSQATVTSILDRLEQQGFAERHRSDKDKRKVNIHLTDKANEILKTNPPLLQEDFSKQFDKLADWEKSMIMSSLQRLASMMNTQAIAVPSILGVLPLDSVSPEEISYP